MARNNMQKLFSLPFNLRDVLHSSMPTKKTTKKTTSKKTAVKKAKKLTSKKTVKKAHKITKKQTAKQTIEKKNLVKAKGSACFWTRDGLILESLVTLSNALRNMSDDEFYHHVTKDKNDFADWVEEILHDAECASALRKSKKPNTAATVVVRHLKYYKI